MKINKKQKQFIKIYILLVLLLLIVLNWNNISWIFNYRVVSSLLGSFFNPYPESSLLVNASDNLSNINENLISGSNTISNKVYPPSDKESSIEIPKINIVAPLVMGSSTNNNILTKELDKGVVYYPGSVLPSQQGQIVVLGHSAPSNWPKIKHDWVFSEINNLKNGDKIILHFDRKKYTYTVVKKDVVKIGTEVTMNGFNPEDNILTLISCWPPGKNYERILVQSELDA